VIHLLLGLSTIIVTTMSMTTRVWPTEMLQLVTVTPPPRSSVEVITEAVVEVAVEAMVEDEVGMDVGIQYQMKIREA
jgi:hypothetical protein